MSVVLALASALAYGTSDFLAGLMTRRAHVFVVALVAQTTATVVTWIALPWTANALTHDALVWGCLAGVGASWGSVFLYRGLANGQMSVVGPLSAVVTAGGSALVGVTLGDRPTPLQIAGIALACIATATVSIERRHGSRGRRTYTAPGFLDGVLAGAGFALLFVALHRAGSAAGLWPVAMSQATSLLLIAAVALWLGLSGRIGLGSARVVYLGAVPAGLFGGAATVAYFVATQHGLLAISAVLTSLYPAATVVLAVLVLSERLRPVQGTGLLLAAASVSLLATGR
jgi:drug/metabolite transporter (DMT)-like permease